MVLEEHADALGDLLDGAHRVLVRVQNVQKLLVRRRLLDEALLDLRHVVDGVVEFLQRAFSGHDADAGRQKRVEAENEGAVLPEEHAHLLYDSLGSDPACGRRV